MSPEIRDASADDRAALVDLWVGAWRAALPKIDFEARRDWIGQHLDALIANGARLLVAGGEDEPFGFITVDRSGEVDQLVVAARHQGRGIGGLLLSAAKAACSAPLRLSVNTDNPKAVRFYQHHGFRVSGRGTNPRSGLPVLHLEG